MAVIDASVFVAMLNPTEPGYAASVAWFQQEARLKKVISAPVILMAEVAAAMSRGMGNTTLAHQVIQQLSRSTSIQLYPITQSLAEQAAVIAADHRIRGCDAVYVALAQQLGETLITLDREQLQRGTAVIPTNQP
ncbi:MAG: type II toxin-antitoxin system VapC family toxin [Ardenticatenaceae bacterium]|nr:type II toxin-antitoxin system VapC family toxin [Ardenticatenaceae bacterium]